MEYLLSHLDKMLEYAVNINLTRHLKLIELWKDQANSALKNLLNNDNLCLILKNKFNIKPGCINGKNKIAVEGSRGERVKGR